MISFMLLFIAAFYLLLIATACGAIALWVWMIIDVATKENEGNDKLVWLLIVLFAGAIGAVIYYFVRKRPRDAEKRRLAAVPRV